MAKDTADTSRDPLSVVPPINWESAKRRAVPTFLGSLALVGFFGLGSTLSERTELRLAALFMAFALLPLTLGSYGTMISPWRRGNSLTLISGQSTTETVTFTVLPYSRFATTSFYALCSTYSVLFLSAPIMAQHFSGGGTRLAALVEIAAPALPVLALIPGACVLSFLVRKRKRLAIGLGPDGVYHWTLFGCSFFRWEWITEIRAEPGSLRATLMIQEPKIRPVNAEENWLARSGLIRGRRHHVGVGALNAHPVVPYYALWFYLRNPDLRQELGTGAGTRRIQEMDFPGFSEEIRRHGELRPTHRRLDAEG